MRGAKLAGARDLTIATDWSTRSESDGVEVEEEEEDFLLGMLQTFLWAKGKTTGRLWNGCFVGGHGGSVWNSGGGRTRVKRSVLETNAIEKR